MNVLHMSGAGNDFMVIDARNQDYDFSSLSKELCAMTGADGFMAVGLSSVADFRLHFYNSDGSRGEMCGNGARCICKYAYDRGVSGESMVVETDAGLVYGWRLAEDRYRVKLNNPGVLDLDRTQEAAYVELGCPGIPHSVTEVPGLTWDMAEDLRPKAKALRFHPAFPKGVNANLYTWLDKSTIRILTYERGVENYTLACGTGCGSTAAVLWTKGQLPGGVLTAENKGGRLTVTIQSEDDRITGLFLEGPAVYLKEYTI